MFKFTAAAKIVLYLVVALLNNLVDESNISAGTFSGMHSF